MIQPKKCAICECIDELGGATCRMCGEASWKMIWVPGGAPPLEPVLELVPVTPDPPKPKKSKK